MSRLTIASALVASALVAATLVATDRWVRRRHGAGLLARSGRATTVLTVRR